MSEIETFYDVMRRQGAAIIGRAVADHAGQVRMITPFGGQRIVDMLVGDQLPRIC